MGRPVTRVPRVRFLKVADGMELEIEDMPHITKDKLTDWVRKNLYGYKALLVQCGPYVYNVTDRPEIYEKSGVPKKYKYKTGYGRKMKKAKRVIERKDKSFRLDRDNPWVNYRGSFFDAVPKFMISCEIAVSVLDIKALRLAGTTVLYEVSYTVPKLSDEAIRDILKRRERGDSLQDIGDVYGRVKQTIWVICKKHGVTKVPPPDKLHPDKEEAICTVCGKTFTRVGSQVKSEKKTCSDPCTNEAISLAKKQQG